MTSYAPTSYISKTLLGTALELEGYTGVTKLNDTRATLNRKHGVFADTLPNNNITARYFGIGIRGKRNVGDDALSEPIPVLDTNMDLYESIPFRCVPVEQDLTAPERSQYRIRVKKTFRGAQYWCYYLKRLSFSDETVRFTKKNPISGAEEAYALDYANLNPTPPVATINGTSTSAAAQEINASVSIALPLTGLEVIESISAIYGDLRRAVISEIGIYAGEDQVVTGQDFVGANFNYTEAVMAQLTTHYTFNGHDMSRPESAFSYAFRLGSGDIIAV